MYMCAAILNDLPIVLLLTWQTQGMNRPPVHISYSSQ